MKVLKAEGIADLTNDELAAVVDALPRRLGVIEALVAVGFLSSGHHCCKARLARADRYGQARAVIREEHALTRGKRTTATSVSDCESERLQLSCWKKTVRRLMAEEGHHVSYRKKRRPAAPTLERLVRLLPTSTVATFVQRPPDEKWLTGITQLSIPASKVCLRVSLPLTWVDSAIRGAQVHALDVEEGPLARQLRM